MCVFLQKNIVEAALTNSVFFHMRRRYRSDVGTSYVVHVRGIPCRKKCLLNFEYLASLVYFIRCIVFQPVN